MVNYSPNFPLIFGAVTGATGIEKGSSVGEVGLLCLDCLDF